LLILLLQRRTTASPHHFHRVRALPRPGRGGVDIN
jgi:hypothetical protein